MTMTNEKANDRQEIENLLPWHAAGTLNRRDAERVEHALARDEELARRFEMVREELAETIHLNESLGAPSARAMEKLFAAIDAEGALKRKTGFAFDLRTHVAEFLAGFAPRTVAYASAAAALVILLQAGVIGSMLLKGGPGFSTASAPDAKVDSLNFYASAPDAKVDSLNFYVNFNPQASAADITRFLKNQQGSIVEGPRATGTYVVRFTVAGTSKGEAARLTKEMQQNRSIVTSEFEAPTAK